MRVLLGYLRNSELHIPKFLSPSAVKREARFYNIETPKIETPRDSPRKSVAKSVRLRKHGIYTSDITKLFLKVRNPLKPLQKINVFNLRLLPRALYYAEKIALENRVYLKKSRTRSGAISSCCRTTQMRRDLSLTAAI